MTDKLNEILASYKFWDDRVKRKRRQIARLRDRKTSMEISYSDMPKGSGSYTMEDYVADLEDLEEELREIRRHREEAYDDIFRLLVRMRSSAQIDVIYRRHILLQSWPQICRGRDIGKDAAMDCYERAIYNLEKLVDPT